MDSLPFLLNSPDIRERKPDKKRIPYQIEQHIIANRKNIADLLKPKIQKTSNFLSDLNESELENTFLIINHKEGFSPLSLSGTDLKPISESSKETTFVIPKSHDLNKLQNKLNAFGYNELKKGNPENANLFAYFNSIERGQPFDRLSQELQDNYEELVNSNLVICEIEMMSFKRGSKQQQRDLKKIRSDLTSLFGYGDGVIFEHEEIGCVCRAVVRCKGSIFKKLVEDDQWQTKIVWFDEKPQFQTYHQTVSDFNIQNVSLLEPDSDAPIVCVIDSGVTENNPFIKPIIKSEMLKSFLQNAPDNPNDECGHGSGVSSLVSYYALNITSGAENKGDVWIASARVLDENNECDDRLLSKVITEVVQTFVPLGVKIFNFSINLVNRHWHKSNKKMLPRKSWLARRFDQLSKEFDIIFVISSGNIDRNSIRFFYVDNLDYPKYLDEDQSCILDPAQAALAISVGSIAHSTKISGGAQIGLLNAIANEKNLPSPFTRRGPGISGEIKPELVEFGGNLCIDDTNRVIANNSLSIVQASHKVTPAFSLFFGTSFAAPRVTNKLAKILKYLNNLNINPTSNLLKALLINSSDYNVNAAQLKALGEQLNGKNWLNNILGYGTPEISNIINHPQNMALMVYQGEIESNSVAFFDIPVPQSLVDIGGEKQLTITLSFSPEIQSWGLENYFSVVLKWKVFRGDISKESIIEKLSKYDDMEETEEGFLDDMDIALNANIDVSPLPFKPSYNLRSRGAIQHASYHWEEHKTEFKDKYTLVVLSYKKWQKKVKTVPYSIVVRLEDLSHSINIHSQISRILSPIIVKTKVKV